MFFSLSSTTKQKMGCEKVFRWSFVYPLHPNGRSQYDLEFLNTFFRAGTVTLPPSSIRPDTAPEVL